MRNIFPIGLLLLAGTLVVGMFLGMYLGEKHKREFNLACLQAGKSIIGRNCVGVVP